MTIGAGIAVAAIWLPVAILAYTAPLLAFGTSIFAVAATEAVIKKSGD